MLLLDAEHMNRLLEKAKVIRKQAQDAGPDAPADQFLSMSQVLCQNQSNCQLITTLGKHKLKFDEPLGNGGDDTALAPVFTLLCALSACMEMNWVIYTSASKMEVKKVEMEVTGWIDLRFTFDDKVPVRIKRIELVSKIYTNDSAEKVARVYEKVKKYCIVGGSLHPDIEKTYRLEQYPA